MSVISNSAGLLFKIDADSTGFKREMNAVESSIGSLGSKFNSFAGFATVGAAAIATVGTAAIAGATALFNFTKEAADFGSALYDASIKTGLSAASISALRVAAEGSGSSLEAVSGSVAKFNVLVGQAAQGNEKAVETLKRYGITATETNEAFNQAIEVIGRMTTQEQRAIASKDLFKDKTAQMLPIVDQVNGKFKEYTETARKLGIVLSEEDLKAADDFGDTLGVLGTQAKIAGVKFATELMPMVTSAMSSISQYMADNQGVAREWGQALVTTASGVGVAYEVLKFGVTAALDQMTFGMWRMLGDAKRWGVSMQDILLGVVTPLYSIGKVFGGPPTVGGPLTITDKSLLRGPSLGGPSGGGKGGGGGGGKSDAEAKAREELQAQIEGQQFVLSQLEKNYKDTMARIRAEFKKSGDSDAFTLAANKANEDLSNGANAVLAVLDALERKALKDPTATKSKNLSNKQQKRADDLNILKSEDFEENAQLIADAVQKIFDDLKKIATDNAKDTHDILVRNAYDELAAVKDANLKILESEWSTKKQRIAARDAIFAAIKKNAGALIYENKAVHENSIMDLNDWRDAQTAEINKTIQDEELRKGALETVHTEYQRRLDLINEIFDAENARIDEATAVPVPADPEYNFDFANSWQTFKDSVLNDGPSIGEALTAVKDIGVGAFKAMADGIGSMVQAWVLYGTAGPQAMRKMVASVLAGVAAQSAVLAIFELAKGFAALFFNPAEAAAHFKAAALFGSIAVATGLAGRAVAGDAFNQQAGGTGSGGGSGGDAAGQPERLNFTERFEGFLQRSNDQVTNMLQRTNEVLGGVAESVDTFNQKFGVTTPGAVVMAGAGDAGEAIFGAVTGHLDSDLRASSNFIRSQGKME